MSLAPVAEMVYAADLKSVTYRFESSNLSGGTIENIKRKGNGYE